MRKMITVLLAASLVTAAFLVPTADAKKRKPRRVTRTASGEYTAPGIVAFGQVGDVSVGGVSLPTGSNEKYAKVEVVDASGLAIPASLQQDQDGDTFTGEGGETRWDFCGKQPKYVKIDPGYDAVVYVQGGACGGGAGMATQGTVKITFSNLP